MKAIINKIKGFGQLPKRASLKQLLAGLIGGSIAIGCIGLLAEWQGIPLLMAPFGASCVLLFAAPDSPLAQPRNVIGGHMVSSLIGVIFLKYIGHSPIDIGLAVGVATAAMQASRTLHAPAGADPILVLMTGNIGWSFLIVPVLVGAIILVLIALVINNLVQKQWPHYW